MWQPSGKQWWILWVIAAAAVLLWPTGGGKSLALKTINFAADPLGRLPILPPPLPLGLGDDGFAVARHDAMESAYHEAYRSSWLTRTRIHLRDLDDPFDPTTERQVVAAIAILGGLLIWRLEPTGGSTRKRDAGAD